MKIDREKVIYDIERCICHVPDACMDCSHYGQGEAIGCMEELLTDALELLKKQEAVTPTWNRGKPFCGACGLRIHGGKFCSECGKPIAWEGR